MSYNKGWSRKKPTYKKRTSQYERGGNIKCFSCGRQGHVSTTCIYKGK